MTRPWKFYNIHVHRCHNLESLFNPSMSTSRLTSVKCCAHLISCEWNGNQSSCYILDHTANGSMKAIRHCVNSAVNLLCASSFWCSLFSFLFWMMPCNASSHCQCIDTYRKCPFFTCRPAVKVSPSPGKLGICMMESQGPSATSINTLTAAVQSLTQATTSVSTTPSSSVPSRIIIGIGCIAGVLSILALAVAIFAGRTRGGAGWRIRK